jgi:hypothetical protein
MNPALKDKVAVSICLLSAGGALAGLRAGWQFRTSLKGRGFQVDR